MARLKSVNSGVVVVVHDDLVERLGSEWEPAESETKRGPGRPKKSE